MDRSAQGQLLRRSAQLLRFLAEPVPPAPRRRRLLAARYDPLLAPKGEGSPDAHGNSPSDPPQNRRTGLRVDLTHSSPSRFQPSRPIALASPCPLSRLR